MYSLDLAPTKITVKRPTWWLGQRQAVDSFLLTVVVPGGGPSERISRQAVCFAGHTSSTSYGRCPSRAICSRQQAEISRIHAYRNNNTWPYISRVSAEQRTDVTRPCHVQIHLIVNLVLNNSQRWCCNRIHLKVGAAPTRTRNRQTLSSGGKLAPVSVRCV